MVSRTRADVVLLTAIEPEYAAVKQVEAGSAPDSRWIEEEHHGLPVALREFVTSRGGRLRIAVARAPDMGKGAAVARLASLVEALGPSCIAMCGVCAGRPGKTALGDVVVGERLYDYDAGKWKEVSFEADVRTYSLPAPWKIAAEQFDPKTRFGGQDWWQGRPVPYEWQENWVLTQLHQGIDDPGALPECEDRCPQWDTVIENLWAAGEVKRNTGSLTEKGRERAVGLAVKYRIKSQGFPDLSPGGKFMPFRLHVAPIGSGSAVREDDDVWGYITPHLRKTLALEMEASALADIVRAREHHDPIKAVVMKGVMDFANHGRDDHFKDWAARASSECLIAFLRDQLAGGAATAPSAGGASGIERQVRDQLAGGAATAPVRHSRKDGRPLAWAVASGKDQYGAFAAFAVGPPGRQVEQRMRWISPGTFLMGSPKTERGRYSDEGPQHEVMLTRGFWLGETPVPQALWVAVMGENPSRFRGERPDDLERPVEQVSWDDCQAFLGRLNAQVAGLAARLPTEAEWERACRAETRGATWADELSGEVVAPELDSIAWYGGNSGGEAHPVGRKAPNPYGLHDMLGNVYEWCQDAWPNPYVPERAVDPASPGQGSSRVIRGGSWYSRAWRVRAAYRLAFARDARDCDLGFRLAGGQESAPR